MNQQAYHALDRPEVFELARPCPFGGPILSPLTTGQAAGPRAGTDQCRLEGAGSPEGMDAWQFARSIRRLAVDAYRALRRPDASDDELPELRRRSEVLLRAARGSRQAEIRRWLWSVHRALDAARRPESLKIDRAAAIRDGQETGDELP
jgi:hypothetical protein